MISFSLFLISILFVSTSFAGDVSSIKLFAAAAFTYDHLKGGGACNDFTGCDYADVTVQLNGGDFKCGVCIFFANELSTFFLTSRT